MLQRSVASADNEADEGGGGRGGAELTMLAARFEMLSLMASSFASVANHELSLR